jgi:hypothetical protein
MELPTYGLGESASDGPTFEPCEEDEYHNSPNKRARNEWVYLVQWGKCGGGVQYDYPNISNRVTKGTGVVLQSVQQHGESNQI